MTSELMKYLRWNKIRKLKNRIAELEVMVEEENKYSGPNGFVSVFEAESRVRHKAALAWIKEDLKQRLENQD